MEDRIVDAARCLAGQVEVEQGLCSPQRLVGVRELGIDVGSGVSSHTLRPSRKM